METLPYCVVGAGPAGLAAARWLGALDVPFEGFERNPDVGGIWNIGFPDSPMYESAHFISSKTLSAYRDFPMPDSYPDYPSHRQILRYLEGMPRVSISAVISGSAFRSKPRGPGTPAAGSFASRTGRSGGTRA